MDEKQFEIITKKMDSLAKLLAQNVIKDKTVNEQVDTLRKAGFRPIEIADLLGKTPNQINVTISLLEKAKKKKDSMKESSEEQTSQTEEQPNV